MKYNLTLRGFLSRLQALVRQRTMLAGEYVLHPDNPGRALPPSIGNTNEKLWENLRRDLKKVLGVDLRPWTGLATSPDFDGNVEGGRDPYRIRMGVLKQKADKARVKDPTITLLRDTVFEKEDEE
jgi:hypothetical protein